MQGEGSNGAGSRGEIAPALGACRGRARWGLVGAPAGSRLPGTARAPLGRGPAAPRPPCPIPPADLSRRAGRGPPRGRARGRRAPAEPRPRAPPSARTSFPRKAGTRRAAQVVAGRPASPAPARRRPAPAGWLLAAAARPHARGCRSQTMEREPEPEREVGARERTQHRGCPSAAPGPSARRIPYPRAPPRSKWARRPLPWTPTSGGLTRLCQEGWDAFRSLPLRSS